MESLADALQLARPPREEETNPLDRWPDDLSGPEFARLVVNSREFRTYILTGLVDNTIPHGVVKELMHYAWGQTVKQIEVKDVSDVSNMSKAELLSQISMLEELAQDLPDDSANDDSTADKDSKMVH